MSDSNVIHGYRDGRSGPEQPGNQDPGARAATDLQDPAERDSTEREPAPGAPAYDPGAPRPLGVERVPTGNAGVDEKLARLSDADHLPADGHIEVYEDVHSGLRDALAALDTRQGPSGHQGPPPPPAASHAYDHRS